MSVRDRPPATVAAASGYRTVPRTDERLPHQHPLDLVHEHHQLRGRLRRSLTLWRTFLAGNDGRTRVSRQP